jgi:uncharacterized protein YkwD
MNETGRHSFPRGGATGVAALFALAALAGCAAGGAAGRGAAASIAGGKFTPTSPPAANYGPDPSRKCASNSISEDVQTDAAKEAARARKPVPQADGQLCAMADALMAWDDKQPVPESLRLFLPHYFGIAQSVQRIVVAELPPESQPETVARISDVIKDYIGTASNLRYGLATTRVRKGPVDRSAIVSGGSAPTATKIALVLQDATLDLEAVPRKLDPSGEATVKGKLLGSLQNPRVLISDTRGKLQQPPEQKGKDLSAKVACEGRTGRTVVEIRAEEQGSPKVVADFPVLCGIDPPTSVDLAPAETAGPAQQERTVFDRINRERTAAGLPALAWDDRVAQAARAASVSEAQAASSGSGSVMTAQELAQKLRQAGVGSSIVLQNPAQAFSAGEAHDRFELSPVHRGNYMSTDATHGAVGVALYKGADSQTAVVNEVFVRLQAAVDLATVRPKVREAIEKNRAASGSPPFKNDPALEKVAEEYAKELASAGGEISNARHSQLVTPLYKSFRTVDLLSGPQLDPTSVADEKTVLTTKEKLIGLGLAQGDHKTLGQNVFYVVLVFGTKK